MDKLEPAPGYGEPQWRISYDTLDFCMKQDKELAPGENCLQWISFSPDTFKNFLNELTGLNWESAKFYYDSVQVPVAAT